MSNQQHILLIAVGPVQTFIAAGRKLRDLAAGSRILSDLSKEIAVFLDHKGCEVIFPSLPTSSEARAELLVANKILAITSAEDVARLVSDVKAEVDAFYLEKFDAAKTNPKCPLIDQKTFDAQRKDIGEFYSAWVPLIPDSYDKSLEAAEKLLARRKAFRNFAAPDWTSPQNTKKSSLDGIRESVLLKDNDHDNEVQTGFLKPGEELDGIGLIKRLTEGFDRFDSLTSLALGPFLAGLEKPANKDLKENVRTLETRIRAYPVLSTMLPRCCHDFLHSGWIEAAREAFANKNYKDKGYVREVVANLQLIEKEIRDLKAPQPGIYATVIHGDGDHMGAALSKLSTAHEHQAVSEALAAFASNVKTIIEEHEGCLIYSGGDDVLAFLPLHTFRAAVQALQQSFDEHLAPPFADKFAENADPISPPTLSIGAAIVHHKAALSDSLDLARRAETIAKNRFGRNALAITLSKRSGGDFTVGGKWKDDKTGSDFPGRLAKLVAMHAAGEVSAKLAYDLRPLETRFGRNQQGNVTQQETKRIIRQKLDTQAAQELEALLTNSPDLETLCNELILAQFLLQQEDLAKGEWSKKPSFDEESEELV